jgi:hypothetical protein
MELDFELLDKILIGIILVIVGVAIVLAGYSFVLIDKYNRILDEYAESFEDYATQVTISVGDERISCDCETVNGTTSCVCPVGMPNPENSENVFKHCFQRF